MQKLTVYSLVFLPTKNEVMEVQDRRDSPPLWLQLPVSATTVRQRPPASPIFINSITSVILIPLLILLVLSFILSFVSHTSQIFRNNIIKNGWELLNVALVLFAILCGVIGKLHEDEMQPIAIHTSTLSDEIKKNKQTSSFAIFDEFDFTINNPPTSQIMQSGVLNEVKCDDCNIKVIPVDTCVLGPAQSSTKSPLTFLRPPTAINNTNIARKSGAGKDIATAMASLYKYTKRKTKHVTTNKNQKNSESPPYTPATPASYRPPPPHSSSLFSNILKPGVKSKMFSSKPPLLKKVQSNYLNGGKKTVHVGSNQPPEFPLQKLKIAEAAFEYPELENVDLWSTMGSHDTWEGNQLGGSVLCPSPDVNIKADKFIARLRGEWNLDKINY